MKKLVGHLIIFLIFSAFLTSCSTLGGGSSFKLRKYKEEVWGNGLKVIYIKDDSLPLTSLHLLVDAGQRREPEAKSGLAAFVGELFTKGTVKLPAEKLSEELSERAIDIKFSVDSDYVMMTANSLTRQKEEMADYFSSVLLQPRFSKKELNRLKKITLSQLQKTVDYPKQLVGQAYSEAIFGDHPYGKRSAGKVRDVQSFKRKDILRFYRRYYRPNQSMLAIVGNYDEKFVQQLKKNLSPWKNRVVKPYSYPKLSKTKGIEVQLIDKPDLKQTQIRMGHLGIDRKDKDFLSLRIANTILGGAFFSRLNKEIRIKRGLTYSIRSTSSSGIDKGAITVSTFSRHEKVGETIEQTLVLLKDFVSRGVTDQEVKDTKGLLKGRFPRMLETPESLAYNLLILKFYGISEDYLTDYLGDISSLSASDVNRAIQKHFSPDNIKITVYTSKKKVIQQLRPIGVVKVKSYKDYL